MKFLQEIIAKKKHSHQAYRSADPEVTGDAGPDFSAQDMHANAWGDEAEAKPSIEAFEVPVENGQDSDDLASFREAAAQSLNGSDGSEPTAPPAEDSWDDGADDSAMAWDEAEGRQHAGEPDTDEDFEYVDRFGAAPEPGPANGADDAAPDARDAADAATINAILNSDVGERPAAPPEIPVSEMHIEEDDNHFADFDVDFEDEPEEVQPAPQPARPAPQAERAAPQTPRPAAPVRAPEPEIAEEPPMAAPPERAPMQEAYEDEEVDDSEPDASLFFDKPAEERIMERTNQILAKTSGQQAAAQAAPAAGKAIWDLNGQGQRAESQPSEEAAPEPAQPRRRPGRVKTRLLGFNRAEEAGDPFAKGGQADVHTHAMNPVGWILVVKGPGRGACFTLTDGASKIGRGEGQAVRLDFGDTSISRDNHAAIAYDEEQRKFYLGHGGKANLVRLNDMPVLSTESLNDGDHIRIGETTLRFMALCGPDFSWVDDGDNDKDAATF